MALGWIELQSGRIRAQDHFAKPEVLEEIAQAAYDFANAGRKYHPRDEEPEDAFSRWFLGFLKAADRLEGLLNPERLSFQHPDLRGHFSGPMDRSNALSSIRISLDATLKWLDKTNLCTIRTSSDAEMKGLEVASPFPKTLTQPKARWWDVATLGGDDLVKLVADARKAEKTYLDINLKDDDAVKKAEQVPTEAELKAITLAAVRLLDAVNRYSIRLGGKRNMDLHTALTQYGLLEAVESLERLRNPKQLPFSHQNRNRGIVVGWPIATVGESLMWLADSHDRLLVLLGLEAICEGKRICYLHNVETNPPNDSEDNTHCIIIDDIDTFTWPSIEDDLVKQLELSAQTLVRLFGQQTTEPIEHERRIIVDVAAYVVTIHGKPYGLNGTEPIKERVAQFIEELILSNGDFLPRPPKIKTRDIEQQPNPVRDLIEAQPGAGCRIPREKLWLN